MKQMFPIIWEFFQSKKVAEVWAIFSEGGGKEICWEAVPCSAATVTTARFVHARDNIFQHHADAQLGKFPAHFGIGCSRD